MRGTRELLPIRDWSVNVVGWYEKEAIPESDGSNMAGDEGKEAGEYDGGAEKGREEEKEGEYAEGIG